MRYQVQHVPRRVHIKIAEKSQGFFGKTKLHTHTQKNSTHFPMAMATSGKKIKQPQPATNPQAPSSLDFAAQNAQLASQWSTMQNLVEAMQGDLHAKRDNLDKDCKKREKNIKKKSDAADKCLAEHKQEHDDAVAAFNDEVQKWKDDQTVFRQKVKFTDDIVRLNVGGQLLTTRLSTLKNAGGFLSSLFSGRYQPDKDAEGNMFIDLDGKHFEQVLNLLRHRSFGIEEKLPIELRESMRYLQLGSAELFSFAKGQNVRVACDSLVGLHMTHEQISSDDDSGDVKICGIVSSMECTHLSQQRTHGNNYKHKHKLTVTILIGDDGDDGDDEHDVMEEEISSSSAAVKCLDFKVEKMSLTSIELSRAPNWTVVMPISWEEPAKLEA